MLQPKKVQQVLTGQITYVYRVSEDGLRSSFRIRTEDGKTAMVTGTGLPNHRGVTYDFHGRMMPARKGEKPMFLAESAIPSDDGGVNAAIAWMVGMFSGTGFGAASAKKVAEHFGPEAPEIIKENINKLSEVEGFTPARIEKMKKKMESLSGIQPLQELLCPMGFTPLQCASLIKELGDSAVDEIKRDPYKVIRICGASFAEADHLAAGLGLAKDAPERLEAGMVRVFGRRYMDGDTTFPAREYLGDMQALLSLPAKTVKEWTETALKDGMLRAHNLETPGRGIEPYLYTRKQMETEDSIAKKALELSKRPPSIKDAEAKAVPMSASHGLELGDEQLKAVTEALSSGFSVITGGPGTGKTTIMKVICGLYKAEHGEESTVLLAPTGKAARRLSESSGMEASTIHHYFRVFDTESRHEDLELPPIEGKLIVVDEASMMDSAVAAVVFGKIGKGSSLVLVGDMDQLPSVGPGAVLRDIIASGLFRTVHLSRVYRSAEGSKIIANARAVNEGHAELTPGRDFHLHRNPDGEMSAVKRLIGKLYLQRASEYGIKDVMLLLPYRRGDYGSEEMSRYIQSLVNPAGAGVPEVKRGKYCYRKGDPVMHTGSNTPEASNGDTGTVEEVDPERGTVKVKMNGKLLEYAGHDLRDLELAYACTVHKSQGSEAPAVITCITRAYTAMLVRNIPYVAFSRAKKEIDVVYDSGLQDAAATCRSDSRRTLLPFCLRSGAGLEVPA